MKALSEALMDLAVKTNEAFKKLKKRSEKYGLGYGDSYLSLVNSLVGEYKNTNIEALESEEVKSFSQELKNTALMWSILNGRLRTPLTGKVDVDGKMQIEGGTFFSVEPEGVKTNAQIEGVEFCIKNGANKKSLTQDPFLPLLCWVFQKNENDTEADYLRKIALIESLDLTVAETFSAINQELKKTKENTLARQVLVDLVANLVFLFPVEKLRSLNDPSFYSLKTDLLNYPELKSPLGRIDVQTPTDAEAGIFNVKKGELEHVTQLLGCGGTAIPVVIAGAHHEKTSKALQEVPDKVPETVLKKVPPRVGNQPPPLKGKTK